MAKNEAIVADTDTPFLHVAFEVFASVGAGIVRQFFDAVRDRAAGIRRDNT